MTKSKGFTLVELVVVIAIIGILSTLILFSVSMYLSRGKDSNIQGNLVILVPAGEAWYNGPGVNSYTGFCDISDSVIAHAISQMTPNTNINCPGNVAGLCCNVSNDKNSWAACAQEFTDKTKAYCVDSRGVKEEMCRSSCISGASLTQCPGPTTQTNCQ